MRAVVRSTVLVAILVVALAAVVAAQHPPAGAGSKHPMPSGQMGRGMGPGHAMDALASLNLTAEQKQQVQQLMTDTQAKNHDIMTQMRKLHEQLRDAIFADNGPATDIDATAKEINELQGRMLQSQIDLHTQIAKILDPEQRKKMRAMPMPGMMGQPPTGRR